MSYNRLEGPGPFFSQHQVPCGDLVFTRSKGANVSFIFIVVLENHVIAKDSIHMVNLDSSQLRKKIFKHINGGNVYSWLSFFFFFNMPSSCTFVMFNLGENSMKDLIDRIQKCVNHLKWPLIFAKFHPMP